VEYFGGVLEFQWVNLDVIKDSNFAYLHVGLNGLSRVSKPAPDETSVFCGAYFCLSHTVHIESFCAHVALAQSVVRKDRWLPVVTP